MLNRLIYTLTNLARKIGVRFHEEQDARVQAMRQTIERLGGIQFTIEIDKHGNWAAESVNIKGIITGGTSKKNMNETIKDAIFTYFEIPPQLCNDRLMRAPDEPIKLEQRIYA